jgi:hypothetical protein
MKDVDTNTICDKAVSAFVIASFQLTHQFPLTWGQKSNGSLLMRHHGL